MSPMLFLAPLYWPNKVVLKSLHELFELFTGVNEDKYGSEIQIEGEIKKITLLRLSSINEKENNTIKSKNELEELERDLREMRNKKKGNEYSPMAKAVIADEKFLLSKNDYLITTRGEVRVVNLKVTFENHDIPNEVVPTQHFICLRPRKNTIRQYQKEYLDIIVQQIAEYLQNRSKEKNICQLKLKLNTGGKLDYQLFKEGQKIIVIDKQGNIEPWQKNTLYQYTATNLDNPNQKNIKFTVKNGVIEEIPKAQFNIISIKELEAIEINIDEDEESRASLVSQYKKMIVQFDEIKYRLKFFNENLQNTLFINYDQNKSV